jgi:hypothetical protein
MKLDFELEADFGQKETFSWDVSPSILEKLKGSDEARNEALAALVRSHWSEIFKALKAFESWSSELWVGGRIGLIRCDLSPDPLTFSVYSAEPGAVPFFGATLAGTSSGWAQSHQ